MRHLILSAAVAVMLSGTVNAREPAMEIAMGSTSAAHLPTSQPRDNASSDCTLPYGQCPEVHQERKYRHKTSTHSRRKHFPD
jgi:hypothetical protein